MGTNTVRLLVAELSSGCSLNILHQESVITRLGEGFGKSPIITGAALRRTIDALLHYREIIHKYNVNRTVIVATSAIREALNNQWFLSNLRQAGFQVVVISPNEEAKLTHTGILHFIKEQVLSRRWMAFDLGGGSTEFMLSQGKNLTFSLSVPVGVVKLLEMFIRSDPPTATELSSASSFFRNKLSSNIDNTQDFELLVGNAGTVTTLAAIDLGLRKYEYRRTEGHILEIDRIKYICSELNSITSEERLKKFPILQRGREDVISIGCSVVVTIMEYFKKRELVTTNGSLREGVLINHFC